MSKNQKDKKAHGKTLKARKGAGGRKPKSDLARQTERVQCQAWSRAVARERKVRLTGYALTKEFDPSASDVLTEEWVLRRSKTWDRRLAGQLGMPRAREFDRVSPPGTRSRWLAAHVIWKVPQLVDPTPSEIEKLLRQLNPRILRSILPDPKRSRNWTNDDRSVIEAAQRISTESNLDALAALLLLAKTDLTWDEYDCEFFAMEAFAVFLRVIALEQLEPIAGEMHALLFGEFWRYDWKPSRLDPEFHPWIPTPEDIDVEKAVTENALILKHITPRIFRNAKRGQEEKILYFSDISGFRNEIVRAAKALSENPANASEEVNRTIQALDTTIRNGNLGSRYEYYATWWMSGLSFD